MSINISAFENNIKDAIAFFWESRKNSMNSQKKRGIVDQGNRSGVTTGKNLDGIIEIIQQTIRDNGLTTADIYINKRIDLTIPGFFRPTKNWDVLIVKDSKLIAAIELKSQVGPSFGNNFNNRIEEAIGNAVDINKAFREGAFGESTKPFVGYLFVLENCEKSNSKVRIISPHFDVLSEFKNTSYAERYDIFCRKLIQEQLYDSASLLLTKKENKEYVSLSELTNIRNFFLSLASKVSEIASI